MVAESTISAGRTPCEVVVTEPGTETSYTLTYTVAAFHAMELAEQKTLGQIIGALNQVSYTAISRMLWGALRAHHAKLSFAQAMEIIDRIGFDRAKEWCEATLEVSQVASANRVAAKNGGPPTPRPKRGRKSSKKRS